MRLTRLITMIIDWFYIEPISSIMPRQTFRYAACGGANVVIGWFWYFLIYNYVINKEFTDLGIVVISPHIAAMLTTLPIIFFVGFWLNRNVAFRKSPLTTSTQLFRYAMSMLGSILLNYICLKLFVEALGFWATPSQMLSTIAGLIYSYLIAKYYTFRDAEE